MGSAGALPAAADVLRSCVASPATGLATAQAADAAKVLRAGRGGQRSGHHAAQGCVCNGSYVTDRRSTYPGEASPQLIPELASRQNQLKVWLCVSPQTWAAATHSSRTFPDESDGGADGPWVKWCNLK